MTGSAPELPAGSIRLLHLSDLHLGKPRPVDPRRVFQAWLDEAEPLSVSGIVLSGDLVERPDDVDELRRIERALCATGLPFWAVPGNHDVANPDAPGPFHAIFGPFPRVAYLGPVDLLLFDSFAGLPLAARSPREHARRHEPGFMGHGRVAPDDWSTIDAELRQTSQRIAVVHHGLDADPDHPVDPELRDALRPLHDAETFAKSCALRRVELVLHGHLHPHRPPYERDALTVVRGGASTKLPARARLIDLDGIAATLRDVDLGTRDFF